MVKVSRAMMERSGVISVLTWCRQLKESRRTVVPSRGFGDTELGVAASGDDGDGECEAHRVGGGGHPCRRGRVVIVGRMGVN